MKLNHINLTVTDVPGAATFLEKYFDLKSLGGNDGIRVVKIDGDPDRLRLAFPRRCT